MEDIPGTTAKSRKGRFDQQTTLPEHLKVAKRLFFSLLSIKIISKAKFSRRTLTYYQNWICLWQNRINMRDKDLPGDDLDMPGMKNQTKY